MLNLDKFINNFNVSINGGTKTSYKWSNERGEGDYISLADLSFLDESFIYDKSEIVSDLCSNEILNHISDQLGIKLDKNSISINNNEISFDVIEDNDCNFLSLEEQKTEKDMYICHYRIYISINGISLDVSDLIELFGLQ